LFQPLFSSPSTLSIDTAANRENKHNADANNKAILKKGGVSLSKNIGTWDALGRITCGLVGLAWCAAKSRRYFPYAIALISAMKVAEGITGYCPMLALLHKSTLDHKNSL
jgi:hypothetical protein